MKKISKILFALVLGLYANATPKIWAEEALQYCKSLSSFAEQVMSCRQFDGSKAHLIEIVNNESSSDDINGERVAKELIEKAFNTPIYETEQEKKERIELFRDEVYLKCVKSMD